VREKFGEGEKMEEGKKKSHLKNAAAMRRDPKNKTRKCGRSWKRTAILLERLKRWILSAM